MKCYIKASYCGSSPRKLMKTLYPKPLLNPPNIMLTTVNNIKSNFIGIFFCTETLNNV